MKRPSITNPIAARGPPMSMLQPRYVLATLLLLVISGQAYPQAGFSASALMGSLGASSGDDPSSFKPRNKNIKLTPLKDRTSQVKMVKVEIIDAYVGLAREVEMIGGLENTPSTKFIQLKIRIYNLAEEKMPYWSWAFYADFPVSLRDGKEELPIWRSKKLRQNGAWTHLKDGIKVGGWLQPKSNVVDVVAFEAPTTFDKDLRLELNTRNLGGQNSSFYFTVPSKWFEKAPKAPVKK